MISNVEDLPHSPFSRRVDVLAKRLGEAISWIWLVLVAVIVVNVTMRYLFSQGRIEFEEMQWHLYAVGFLLGLSYACNSDSHVRVDVLRERMSAQTVAWIEFYGIILLLLPFILLVCWASLPFIAYSFETSEISESPGGLPYRWIIKSFLLIGFLALLVCALARLSRVWLFLFRQDEQDESAEHDGR